MTYLVGASLALFALVAMLYVLGRRNVPSDLEAFCRDLSSESSYLRIALELQLAADKAMASDAMRRATTARDGLASKEAVRLVDIACRVLSSASEDRVRRLRGMALCVRMASAAAVPVSPLDPGAYRLAEIRTLFSASLLAHHVLVSAAERLLLKIMFLRFGYRLAVRAMRGGTKQLHVDPAAVTAWARCSEALEDWTSGLDPESVAVFRAVLAMQAAGERAA